MLHASGMYDKVHCHQLRPCERASTSQARMEKCNSNLRDSPDDHLGLVLELTHERMWVLPSPTK